MIQRFAWNLQGKSACDLNLQETGLPSDVKWSTQNMSIRSLKQTTRKYNAHRSLFLSEAKKLLAPASKTRGSCSWSLLGDRKATGTRLKKRVGRKPLGLTPLEKLVSRNPSAGGSWMVGLGGLRWLLVVSGLQDLNRTTILHLNNKAPKSSHDSLTSPSSLVSWSCHCSNEKSEAIGCSYKKIPDLVKNKPTKASQPAKNGSPWLHRRPFCLLCFRAALWENHRVSSHRPRRRGKSAWPAVLVSALEMPFSASLLLDVAQYLASLSSRSQNGWIDLNSLQWISLWIQHPIKTNTIKTIWRTHWTGRCRTLSHSCKALGKRGQA